MYQTWIVISSTPKSLPPPSICIVCTCAKKISALLDDTSTSTSASSLPLIFPNWKLLKRLNNLNLETNFAELPTASSDGILRESPKATGCVGCED